jgi:hypothetical protein
MADKNSFVKVLDEASGKYHMKNLDNGEIIDIRDFELFFVEDGSVPTTTSDEIQQPAVVEINPHLSTCSTISSEPGELVEHPRVQHTSKVNRTVSIVEVSPFF